MNDIYTWVLNKNVEFKSQEDVWRYLISSQDTRGVRNKVTKQISTLKEGKSIPFTFAYFKDYEPVELSIWVNELLIGPLACVVWNDLIPPKSDPTIEIIYKYVESIDYGFMGYNSFWKNARPATHKEIKNLCWEALVL